MTQALLREARQKTLIPVNVLRGRGRETRSNDSMRCDIRRNELREPFPDEDADEDSPEEADTLLLRENSLATVEGVEELDGGQQVGEDNVRWVDQEGSHQTYG